ncbi:Chitinase class I [compost metagenome]
MNLNNEPYSYQLVSYATPKDDDPSAFYVASQFIKEERKIEPDWMIAKQDIPSLYPISRNSYLRKSKEQGEAVAAGLPKMSKIARTTAQPVVFSNMKEYLEIEVWKVAQGKLTDGTGRVVQNASKGERYWVAKEMLGQPSDAVRHTPIIYDQVVVRHTNPIPVKGGEVVGHWGEHETPKPMANGFVLNEDRKAIHMEIFVAESDKEALGKCISNEGKLTKGQEYLLLKEGEQADTYKLTKENNKIGFSKVGAFGPLEAPKPINTQDIVTHGADKFVKVAEDQHVLISGDTRLVSQHEWARLGVTLVDGGSDPDGFLDKADTDGKEGGDFFSTLYKELVTDQDGDGSISADEIKAAMAEKMVADKVRKLFIKHESEWVKRETWPRLEQELKNMPNLCKYVLEVTNEMAWIEKAAAVVGDTKPWFIHPAGMIGLVEPMVLTSNKCKKCRKDISLSFEFMRNFTPSSVSDSRINDFITTWNNNAVKYGINSCEQVINLLGQGKHETKRFTAFRESLVYRSYTAESLYAMAPTAINNGFARKGLSLSREEKMDYIRRHLLNNDSGYGEHSFGSNEFPGKDYRGRGLLHLTHAENYRLCALATGLNIYSNPELVETDMSSIVLSGFWFWSTNSLGLIADNDLGYVDKVNKVTKIINPGLKGLEERIEFTAEARELHVRLYGECN